VASLSQGRTAAAQCGLFTHKSVPVIFEPPCISVRLQGSVTHKTTPYVCAPIIASYVISCRIGGGKCLVMFVSLHINKTIKFL